MKRSWNRAVWTGASLVFLGVVSYPLFFVRFPGLRDFPWANLPMIALGLVLLVLGLVRAFRHPDLCRGAGVGIQRIFPLRHFHRRVGFAAHGSMSGNNDRLAGHLSDVPFCRAYVAVNASSRPVVDKGVIAVPEGVSGVENVGLRKMYGDI